MMSRARRGVPHYITDHNGITVIHNNWLGYPFMVCNEANLDLFPQREDCSQ